MANNKKTIDYSLVKVEGYSANKKYMYARTFPDGEKISIAVHKSIKTDFINYLSDENDSRYAPPGSVVALFNLSNVKDSFYLTKWAKTVSKKPQTEDVIVSPTTVSPIIDLGEGNTQVLARIIDPAPISVRVSADLKAACLNAITMQSKELDLGGKRGFMVRVGAQGQSGVESACFKSISNANPEQIINTYFGGNGQAPSNAMKSIMAAAKKVEGLNTSFIEVVGFTDAPVFNYGNSDNDQKLANTPNFRVTNKGKVSPTFSNTAITIDRQTNKILRITPLPDKNIISNVHGLVGSHDKSTPQSIQFILPKQFRAQQESNINTTQYPIKIEPYIDQSNQQFNSIIVKVNADAPMEVHSRILSATNYEPRKGAGGYYFNRADRKRVESALSDLAGTPALYTTTGTVHGERYVFIAGRTNDPQFKNKLESLASSNKLSAFNGGLYGILEKDSISILSEMTDIMKEPAKSKLLEEYSAKKPVNNIKEDNNKKPTYVEWLDANYRQNPQNIATEFNNQISSTAKEAGIDWENSRGNIIWPTLNGNPESIGTTANVKPERTADNGSCYISTMFNSWETNKGNKQYGIIITFTNLNKDKEQRWTYSSHHDTYNKYSEEVWGASKTQSNARPAPTAEEIEAEQNAIQAENKIKIAAKIAKADAQKKSAFNDFSNLVPFSGSHKGIEQKQLPNFISMVNARAYTIKSNPSNKAFAFAAYDIHDRFAGYQYITEEKLLLNKERPDKKSSWSNKMFCAGFQKDDVGTGLPLGTHHTLGEINPNEPHDIYYSEGWANAGSNFEVTNNPSVLCFDKDNMKKVIGLMVKKYPNHNHIHVADNDLHSSEKGNVGVMAALENAYNFGAKVVIPNVALLDGYLENKYTDTSDLYTNNQRDALLNQLKSPEDVSDIILNYFLRIKHTKENQLDQHISLLAQACDKQGITKSECIAIINEALNFRTIEYRKVEPSYNHPYLKGVTPETLANLTVANNNFAKVDFDIVENDTLATKQDSNIGQDSVWPVTVRATKNLNQSDNNKRNTITEITDTKGEYTTYIVKKLESLGVQYTYNSQERKFYAPYKFINLINSSLSELTGAQKFYAGRERGGDSGFIVIRGDFTNQNNRDEIEDILNPLGIKYDASEMGYVIQNPNTFVYIKEAMIESFSKVNPSADTVMAIELGSPQQTLTNKIEKVAFSLGLERKNLAKQQLKLNQHNPKLGQLESPLVAGVYLQAEQKIKGSELAGSLSPAERVYTQQRTLQTLLSSLSITQPTLEKLYREDIQAAITILSEQMPQAPVQQKPEVEIVEKKPPTNNENAVIPENEQAIESVSVNEDADTPNVSSDILAELNQQDLTLQVQLAVFQDIVNEVLNKDLTFEAPTTPINELNLSAQKDENTTDNDQVESIEVESIEVESIEVESLVTPHVSDVEVRLSNLVDFVQTYLSNEYTPSEIMDSLQEPGSPYYDIETGFKVELLRNDVKEAHLSSFSKQFDLHTRMDSPFSFITAIENKNVESRLAQLDLFIDKILEENPEFNSRRITRAANSGSYMGVTHPYMSEDGVYNNELIKSDLMHIGGFEDITTLTGYFKLRQDELLNNSQDSDFIDAESDLYSGIGNLNSFMPPPSALIKSGQNIQTKPSAPASKNTEPAIVIETTPQAELENKEEPAKDTIKIIINNENSAYNQLYKLAITCAKEQMSYEEFYESVFTSDGVYFNYNPFVKNGKLAKKEVVNSLIPNGFKSPKGFYDSAFFDAQGKTQVDAELTRISGVIPTSIDSNNGIGSQFNVIETLLKSDNAPSLEQALEITKQSFKSWYNSDLGQTVIPLNDIFTENLNTTTSAQLAGQYQINDIKMLADIMGVPANNDNAQTIAEDILMQWKVRQELSTLTPEDFQELGIDECNRIANTLGVSLSPSKADLARNVFKKAEDINLLTDLRIAQYSYVLSALTIEKEKGKVSSFVYRQLNSLISEEANYKPIVIDKLNKIETAKLQNALTDAKTHISKLDQKERIYAALEAIPESPEMVGVQNSDKVGLGTYKYLVTEGDPRSIKKPHHMTGFAVYGQNLILAPSAFSLADMKAYNIQPISNNAITDALSPAEHLLDKQGYISFSTEKGTYGVIHKDKNKFKLIFINSNSTQAESYSDNSFEKSLERAFEFFPVTSFDFTDGFSEALGKEQSDDIKLLNTLYDTLLDNARNDNSYTEVSKDIALDLIARANELGHEIPSKSNDIILQAIDLLDQIKDNLSNRLFEQVISLETDQSTNEKALLDHAVSLSRTSLEKDENAITKKETQYPSLIDELNATAIRDLSTLLTLEEDALTLTDIYDDEVQVDPEQEREALRALSEMMQGIEVPNITIDEPVERKESDDEVNAFFEAEGINTTSNKTNNNQNEEATNIQPGSIVSYSIDGAYKFGFTQESETGLMISRYSSQDEYNTLSTTHPHLFINSNGANVPVFSLDYDSYLSAVKENKKTGDAYIDNLINKANNSSALPVKDIRLLAELTGVIKSQQGIMLASEINPLLSDYFKVNRLGAIPKQLLSNEDKQFITNYFNSDNAVDNIAELTKELTMATSDRISKLAYKKAMDASEKAGVDIDLINHENNTSQSVSLNEINNVSVITRKDLLNITKLPVDVLNAKYRGETSLDGLAQAVATHKEGLPAQKVKILDSKQEVYALQGEDLVLATITTDVFESDTQATLSYVDNNGLEISFTENINDLSPKLETDSEAKSLVNHYLKTTNETPVTSIVSPITTEYDDDGDGDGVIALHARVLANKQINDIASHALSSVNLPKGYQLQITQDEYHIVLNEGNEAVAEYDGIGRFNDLSELNKAILVAKREILGVKRNDTNNALRSDPSESPKTTLPNSTQTVSKGEYPEPIHNEEARGVERAGGSDIEITNDSVSAEPELHREHDSTRDNQSRSVIASEIDRISANGIKLNPNVIYAYDEETTKEISSQKSELLTYELNLEAIKLAKELSANNRTATTEEKNTLAKYRGWGGLSKVLDPSYAIHSSKRVELNQLLSNTEYDSIKRSTLSAFYTSPAIAGAIWQGLERMGVKGGVGIDPAFGIGNFASALPETLQDSITLVAKEIDPLTAEIARHIHGPLVKNEGYEKAKIPANTFDFAVGNIPFGDFKVHDKNHRDLAKNLIHDYFILKTIDKVKPGGFVSFITSSGTLDKKSSAVREQISEQADLIAAIRLPTNAFSDNAGTQVNSDILFFQKRLPEMAPNNTNWLELGLAKIPTNIHGGYHDDIEVNQYFIDNPEMVIGNQYVTSTRYGGKTYRTVLNGDLTESIKEAMQKLPQDIHFEFEPKQDLNNKAEALSELTDGKRLGSYHLNSQGDVAIVMERFELLPDSDELTASQSLEKVELKTTQIAPMKAMINLRDTVKDHVKLMLVNNDSEAFEKSLKELNEKYDAFSKKFGALNKQTNKSLFKADPDAALLIGMERWDKKTKTAQKSDLFTERTIYPRKEFTHVDNVEDAVIISLSEKGKVEPKYIEQLTQKKWPNIVVELGDSVFLNPQSMEWEHSSIYLSGQVRDKLEIAKHAANNDEVFNHNVKCLEEVIPVNIPYYEIRAKLGSSWIPASDIKDFAKFIVTGKDEPCTNNEAEKTYKIEKIRGNWEMAISSYEVNVNSGRTKSEYGTQEWPADKLMFAIINSKSIVVNGKDSEGRTYIIADKTAEATAKADLIKEKFKQWLWDKPERAERLEASYNQKVNGFVEPKFDGSKIEIEGLSSTLKGKNFKPREKQLNAIMRYLVTGRALFLHDVGVGKSFALLGSIIKGKQVGRHSKAMLAVPNAVFPQMQDLALNHFPNAKILMVDAKSLNKENRESTLAQVTTNSWDIVIISHSIAERINVPDDYKLSLIDQEMSEVESAISSLEKNGFHSGLSVKAHQKKLENERKKIMDRMDSEEKYNTVNIQEMGIDALFIDEVDEFVNLNKITNMGHVSGVAVKESNKARAIYYLTSYLHHINGNEGIVLATGTDIRNNIADQFTLMRYLAPDLLMEQDIEMYDDFIGTFGEITTKFEIAPEGSGFIEKTRLSKFYNLPELAMLYRQVADIVNAEDANIERPKITEKFITALPSEEMSLYMAVLAERAKNIRNGSGQNDNLLAITNEGRKAAMDMRFLHPNIPDYPGSKVNLCVENVLHEYHTNKALNPSQIIFSDIGVPNNEGRFDLYNDIKTKLVAGGIDEDKIVFARDFNTDAKKQELQDKMNSGEISVTIGSTENMGVGKNVQERLAAIHDLSIPWRVRDLEQRGGRIERFGNIFENATRYKYTTKDSFDLFIWNKLKQKALFAEQTKRTPRDAAREFDEEVDPSYSEIMAAATGNPLIEESITVESEIDKLAMLERSHHRSKSSRQFELGMLEERVRAINAELSVINKFIETSGLSSITLLGKNINSYNREFESAAKAINKEISNSKKNKTKQTQFDIGDMSGNRVYIESTSATKKLSLVLEVAGEKYELNTHHYVRSLIQCLDSMKVDTIKKVDALTNSLNFNQDKIASINSVNDLPFEFGDKLIQYKQRLTEIQREIAVQSEGSEKESVGNPVEEWNDLLAELNGNPQTIRIEVDNKAPSLDF